MNAASIKARVARKTVEAVDICTFELVAADGSPLPAFSAGSHIDVHIADRLTRPYSLHNPPGESHRYLISVLREPASRGGSQRMHGTVRVGDVLQISAPKNHFPLAPGAERSLLLAGGIGITPILCMAECLASRGAAFQMHYCTRSIERTAFRDRIAASPFASRVHLHVDDGPPAQRLDIAASVSRPEPGLHLYVCGPKGFIDAVLAAARQAGWPESRLHCEFFASDVQPSADDRGFEVQLARSGRIIAVAAGQTAVQALAEAGVDVPTSCEQGVCGTCLTPVLDGIPDHRDQYLTADEQARNDQFLPCCSRALSARLVLDL